MFEQNRRLLCIVASEKDCLHRIMHYWMSAFKLWAPEFPSYHSSVSLVLRIEEESTKYRYIQVIRQDS